MASKAFARVADAVRKEFEGRCHVNSNQQMITVWDDEDAPRTKHVIRVTELRRESPTPPPTRDTGKTSP